MVTTVGTSDDMKSLIENFILLEHDAISAYDATIERLENPEYKARVTEFRNDHTRHLQELTELAGRYGAEVAGEGDMKEILTTGKIKLANLMGGDGALLKAMSTNETDTITAYSNAFENACVPPEERALFERGLADERRHKDWMDQAASTS